MNILFICSQNRLRSPTAEAVFADHPGVTTASAGLNRSAEERVGGELLEWADVIFVMEKAHRNKLTQRFKPHLKNARIITLDIPDDFPYMDPALIRLLKMRVTRFLPDR